jgi:hypothetical protein
MRTKIILLVFILCIEISFVLTKTRLANASEDQVDPCFDFSKEITKSLRVRVYPGTSASGNGSGSRHWAATRDYVSQPLSVLLNDLLNHRSTKGGSISRMRILPMDDHKFWARQIAEYEVDPFPFVTLSWEENWGFSLLKGGSEAPESVLVSFEKTAGTSYIQHLCGNIWLEKANPTLTDVYIYEEVEATRRTIQDTLSGIQGTLRSLAKAMP